MLISLTELFGISGHPFLTPRLKCAMGEVIVKSSKIVFTAAVHQEAKQHGGWPLELVFESAGNWNHPQFSEWFIGKVLVDGE